jgi:hypothetical protein
MVIFMVRVFYLFNYVCVFLGDRQVRLHLGEAHSRAPRNRHRVRARPQEAAHDGRHRGLLHVGQGIYRNPRKLRYV